MQFKRQVAVSLLLLATACGDAGAHSAAMDDPGGDARKLTSLDLLANEGVPLLLPANDLWRRSELTSTSSSDAGSGPTSAGRALKDSGVAPTSDASPDPASSLDAATDALTRAPQEGSTATDAQAVRPDAATYSSQFVGLYADGNRILDADGNAVRIRGVNRSGSEFACVGGYGFFDGPTDAASIAAMKTWNVNAVRILLNEDCWLGINGVSAAYSGPAYQQAIADYVALLIANGMYPIVDLHWNAPGTALATGQQPMADADHAPAFWTSVANAFKSNGSVVFELYNEPWPDNDQDTTAAWTCWRDGGSCPSVPFEVAGMQQLVNVVRATGATNLCLLGGVEYSNALSQWLAFKPTDPLNNLAAAWHVYQNNACSDKACFEQVVGPVALAVPIIATEVGDSSCEGAFMTTVMQWLDAQGQSYSAWTWNAWGAACSNYSLILDYTGTPNGAYGLAVQSHFLSLPSP